MKSVMLLSALVVVLTACSATPVAVKETPKDAVGPVPDMLPQANWRPKTLPAPVKMTEEEKQKAA